MSAHSYDIFLAIASLYFTILTSTCKGKFISQKIELFDLSSIVAKVC